MSAHRVAFTDMLVLLVDGDEACHINSEAWTALHQGIEYALLQETCASSSRPISGFLVWHLACLQAILLQGLAFWGKFDFVCGESVPSIRSRSVFLLRRLGRLSGVVLLGTFDIALVQNGKDGRLDRLPMGLVGGIAHDGQGAGNNLVPARRRVLPRGKRTVPANLDLLTLDVVLGIAGQLADGLDAGEFGDDGVGHAGLGQIRPRGVRARADEGRRRAHVERHNVDADLGRAENEVKRGGDGFAANGGRRLCDSLERPGRLSLGRIGKNEIRAGQGAQLAGGIEDGGRAERTAQPEIGNSQVCAVGPLDANPAGPQGQTLGIEAAGVGG